jgi:hypothetical protein
MSVTRAVVAVTAAGLVLASCGTDDGGTSDDPSASSSPSPTSTVSVPASVALSEPGSNLAFGATASVIFEPTQKRGSVIDLTVKKVTKGSVKDFSAFILDDFTKAATPYYVNVRVRNLGEGEVGGTPVPLWGVDSANTLLPAATFTTTFRKCPSEPLPKTFASGDTLNTCLVFLAPEGGTLKAVSFRPDQDFNPIQWTGDIATPKAVPTKTKKTKKSKQR